jgi:hypothetical protein
VSEQDPWSNEIFLCEAVDGDSGSRLEAEESHLALAGHRRQREGQVAVAGVGVRSAWKGKSKILDAVRNAKIDVIVLTVKIKFSSVLMWYFW